MSSYWLGQVAAQPFRRSVATGRRVDVAIVGGGITGCAAALRLAEGGLRVRVHEARTVASGASGRSGGFALRGGALSYDRAREAYGHDVARALWQWSERYLDRMEALGGDAFERSGSLRLAVDAAERDAIRAEYEALRADGFAAEWIDAPLPQLERFHGAILHPVDGSLQPVRFVRKLAVAAVAAGVDFCEHDRVASLERLDADRILLATDGYGRGLAAELDAAVQPVRNQVLVTEPLEERLFPRPHYARYGHAYWQQLADGRLLLGGFRDAASDEEATDEETTTPTVQAALERFLRELVGRDVAVAQRWSGIFGATADQLPLVGPLGTDGRVWVAAGYSGHGNVLGLACGELVADALLGRETPLLELFIPS